MGVFETVGKNDKGEFASGVRPLLRVVLWRDSRECEIGVYLIRHLSVDI